MPGLLTEEHNTHWERCRYKPPALWRRHTWFVTPVGTVLCLVSDKKLCGANSQKGSFYWEVWGETFRESGQLWKKPQDASGLVKCVMPDWVMLMEMKQNTLYVTLCFYNTRAENTWSYIFLSSACCFVFSLLCWSKCMEAGRKVLQFNTTEPHLNA